MRVLVVQDDLAGRRHLVHQLEQHGYEACSAGTGKSALQQHHRVDLVVLDMDVPDIDDLLVCSEIRRESDTPIIALTGRGTEVERVLAFWAGCDDCARPRTPKPSRTTHCTSTRPGARPGSAAGRSH